MQYLDKLGWPVERIKGRRILNFFRLLIHTRRIKRGCFQYKQKFVNDGCEQEIKELVLLQDPICGKHHG